MKRNMLVRIRDKGKINEELNRREFDNYKSNYIVEIDCRKCLNKQQLLKEVSEKLQFPNYFGENWDALEECLVDLSWLEFNRIVLIFSEVNQLMLNDDESLAIFIEIIVDVVKNWESGNVNYDFYTEDTSFEVVFEDYNIEQFIGRL